MNLKDVVRLHRMKSNIKQKLHLQFNAALVFIFLLIYLFPPAVKTTVVFSCLVLPFEEKKSA